MRSADAPTVQRPEQRFFADPALDRLLGTVFALAQEHYVLLDRVRALEQTLAQSGNIDPKSLGLARDPADDAAAAAQAERFATALLRPLLGLQDSRGLAGKPATAKRKRRSSSRG
jgi:hypothetical protein